MISFTLLSTRFLFTYSSLLQIFGWTALMLASYKDATDTVALLLDRRANIEAISKVISLQLSCPNHFFSPTPLLCSTA
jgi:hypothetical protein